MTTFADNARTSDPTRDKILPRRMSEREFLEWVEPHVKAEWVEGKVIVMAPANFQHADLNLWLARLLAEFVERQRSGVVSWDVLVRLAKGRDELRIPDVFYIAEARKNIIKKTYIDGPPDLVIEVMSPDSQSRDRREKYLAYESAGVREYWIVDPLSSRVEAYALRAGAFEGIDAKRGRIKSAAIPGLFIKPNWLFDKRPAVSGALAEMGVK